MKVMCATCGGSTDKEKKQCDFCGNVLLKLSRLELLKPSSEGPQVREGAFYFRSLQRLYWLATFAGIVMMIVLYFVVFDELSETELVMLSPIWFLLIVFGTFGMYAERAVRMVLTKQANDFPEALRETMLTMIVPLRILVAIVFLLPMLFLRPEKVGSPLWLSSMTAGLWGVALYLFFAGIFPAL